MERVLQTVPKTVAESQWATLVSYWYSEDSKVNICWDFLVTEWPSF